MDETVDPTRLALLPLRTWELFALQVTAALSGAGPLGALLSLTIGTTIGFATVGVGLIVAPLAAVVTVIMVVGHRARRCRDLGHRPTQSSGP